MKIELENRDRRCCLALQIARTLRKAGHEALLAGGCVRDMVLGAPPKDYDIATSALPEQVRSLFERTIPVGASFGVILVVIGGVRFEVTTFRSESAYSDGRHPDAVQYTSDPAQDARRRDFTVNGLFMDPSSGEIIDHVGGVADLGAGVLRAIGDPADRFREDWLRMLRAPRFVARTGFGLDRKTADSIRANASMICGVSAERVRDEITLLLTASRRRAGIESMADLGLLDRLLPEVAAMRGVPQPPEFHPEGDVFTHTMLMLEMASGPSDTLAFGILLHDAGKPGTYEVSDRIRFNNHPKAGAVIAESVCRRLRFSNSKRERITALVSEHMKFINVRRMKRSTLKRFLRMDAFDEHLELHRLDCLSSHGSLENWDFAAAKIIEFGQEELRPRLLIDGRDLRDMGLAPGPAYKVILLAVEEAQLQGDLATKEQALAFALKLASSEGRG